MRLTNYSDYALRVLIYLSIQDGRLATIREISEQYDISRNHLMKLVQDLGKHGFAETVRGKNGGLRIGRDPATISVGEVVRAMEKDMAIVECFEPDGDFNCQIVSACVLAGIMRQAHNAFLEVLDGYSIKDLVLPKPQLIKAFPTDVWSGGSATTVN
ncbi:MAG: Rrf2 family transcriptional regulator [Proteobacteria bacterium]|nr:Rrf2 family transcriptional regulator [Pseudomonadota bacterium]MCK4867644.1 Rrf2 family transcriptional regulator [Alphaproteobacteria bacterium]